MVGLLDQLAANTCLFSTVALITRSVKTEVLSPLLSVFHVLCLNYTATLTAFVIVCFCFLYLSCSDLIISSLVKRLARKTPRMKPVVSRGDYLCKHQVEERNVLYLLCPAPNRRGIKRCFCLMSDVCLTSDVCLSRTSGLSREQRGLGRLKLAQR